MLNGEILDVRQLYYDPLGKLYLKRCFMQSPCVFLGNGASMENTCAYCTTYTETFFLSIFSDYL